MEKCKSRARAVVYWPWMSADIENMVAKCSICLKYRNQNQKEPLMPHETPDRPWQKFGTDIFELYSKSYLIIVDYYSKYPELCLLRDTVPFRNKRPKIYAKYAYAYAYIRVCVCVYARILCVRVCSLVCIS